MAATLSSEIGNTDRIVKLIDDCRKAGLKVLPPDVNESVKDFKVVNGDIRFGLCGIRNVGEGAIESVLKTRIGDGYKNLFDFCARVDLRLVNKKCLESLVQAGAFDGFKNTRAELFENLERAMGFGSSFQSHALSGQSGLFDDPGKASQTTMYPLIPPRPEWPDGEKLAREKQMLGFYVSGHPLLKFEHEINEFANVHFGDLGGFKNGSATKACGIVTAVKKKVDKRGNTMAFVEIEDFSGKAECVVFSDTLSKYQQFIHPDAMVMVMGKGEVAGEMLKIVVNEIYPMEKVREKFTRNIVLSIHVGDIRENTILELRSLMEKNKGNCPCYFNVVESGMSKMYQTHKYTVEPSDTFVVEVKRILGPQNVRFSA
jgi:DNA polymerase-3 subunit alpha